MISDIGRQIIALRQTNKSLKSIAATLKCSKATVSKWCATLRNNEDIIAHLKSERFMPDRLEKRIAREQEILRQVKPKDFNWTTDYNARLREATKAFLMSPVNSKCQVCGYDKITQNLVFHHVDKQAKDSLLSGTRLHRNLKLLIIEASKCILVCHNCHGEIHYGLIDDSKYEKLDFSQYEIPDSVITWYYS